ISLGVVTWAVIGLVRSIFKTTGVGGGGSDLAGALSLILVGLPVFLIHWLYVQKEAAAEPEEKFSSTRGLFLYAVSLSLAVPIVQNTLALLGRLLINIFGTQDVVLSVGFGQLLSDNIIAIVVNLLLAYYFRTVLAANWDTKPIGEGFYTVRRIARFLWLGYGLGMAFIGVQQLLLYVFNLVGSVGFGAAGILVNGLSLTIVGLPVLVISWREVQSLLVDEKERASLLRLTVLYVISFIAAVGTLGAAGAFLNQILQALLLADKNMGDLLGKISDAISGMLPAGAVWAFFSMVLKEELAVLPDMPRRSGMRRLYYYVIGALGLWATFIGLELLVIFVINMLLDNSYAWVTSAQREIAGALSVLIVGLPVWLRNWIPMNAEAMGEDQAGDHARRSVIRKGYLYFVLFIGVMGVMFTTGGLLFQIFDALLGGAASDLGLRVTQLFFTLILFIVVTLYHWQTLRADNRRSSVNLDAQHALFSVVVLDAGDGSLAKGILQAIQKETPELPVVVQAVGEAFGESVQNASAVVLPASLVTNPPKAVSRWLDGFQGKRVVVPTATEDWVWIGLDDEDNDKLGKMAADAVRALAEGEEAVTKARSPWMVMGYVFAGFVGLMFLCMLVSALGELFF
ncbi:MAG: DUF5671 domain-containing protein, partial [Chloroflexota bacterium]